jgi:tetratricopeptide (TPR) repeat protein
MAKPKTKKQITPEQIVRTAPPAAKQEHTSLFIERVSNTKIMVFILCATALCLVPVLQNEFLAFDDPSYVTDNPLIQHLGLGNIKAFFTRQFVSTYQPLVMLSYAIEYKIFGMSGPGFHLFSLLVHLVNVALVFLLAQRLLKDRIAAVVTALLFGMHPLHVESVAWVASQKDVLYACFFLASSLCYLRFVSDNNRKYYVQSMLLFVLSLLSKAQAVVLPVVFLLFDYLQGRKIDGKAIIEKVPFLVLSLIFGVVALTMQTKTGAVQDFSYFPFYERAMFACYGFVCYLMQTVVPIKLSIFYPYPETLDKINSVFVYIAPFVVAALAVVVIKYRKSRIVMFAALFFCITIALVIQLIPVGTAVRADRYSYVSLIGIFLLAGYAFAKMYEQRPAQQKTLTALAGLYFIIIGGLTFSRAMVFNDSMTVYNNALENYPSFMIYNNRGVIFFNNKQYKEALADFQEVEKVKPAFPNIWYNSGYAWQQLGNMPKALSDYTEALKKDPNNLDIYLKVQTIHTAQNDLPAALNDANKIIALKPDTAEAYYTRAELLGRMGKAKEAMADLDKVIAMKPDFVEVYNDRGIANSMAGNYDQALKDFNKMIQLKPTDWNARFNRSLTLKALGRYADAYNDAMTAKNNGRQVPDQYLEELKRLAGK